LRQYPFVYQTGRLFTYKLFLELSYHLLRSEGSMGMIVPSGLYADSWSLLLRELFLDKCAWLWLFSFENRKKIFDIHTDTRFGPVIVARHRKPSELKAAFRILDLQAWERPDPPVVAFDRDLLRLFSPKSRSIPEIRNRRDLDICRKIYEKSVRIGDDQLGFRINFAIEFTMNADAKLFPPLEEWKHKGYQSDVFGRWIGPKGEVAVPLYQGSMVHQFDWSYQGWVSGYGKGDVWHIVENEFKTPKPCYLMERSSHMEYSDISDQYRLAFRRIGPATNTRSMICTVLPPAPCGDSLFLLLVKGKEESLIGDACLSAFLNSFSFDFVLRQRMAGYNLNWFIIEECPIPNQTRLGEITDVKRRLLTTVFSLTFIQCQRRFAPEWLRLKHLYPELVKKEWKHWWAVSEADRLRLRVEIDALCADLYGLEPDDLDWIVRDDPTDPKGFWRVDKHLPYRERLTGLAAAAFRALKAGKWSAESAAKLSNDEFFEIIGIPELTSGPESLIRKREGCHRWKPEEFGKDDPRHGWTWDHCWQDAVALLGSEEAVREYVEGDSKADNEGEDEPASEHTGPKDLFGHPISTDLFGSELQGKSKKKKRS
jgi:hypothetical protein